MADTVLETLIVELKDNGDAFIQGLERTIQRAKQSLGDVQVDLNLGNATAQATRLKQALSPVDTELKELTNSFRVLRNQYVAGVKDESQFRQGLAQSRAAMAAFGDANQLTSAQLVKLSNAMATAQRATDTLDGKMSKLGLAQQVNIAFGNRLQNILNNFGPAGNLAGQGLGVAAKGLAGINTQALGIVQGGALLALPAALGAVSLGVGVLVGGLGLAVAGLTRFTLQMSDIAHTIDQAAQRTQFSTDAVQELSYVADIAGGSFANIETAIVGFTQRLRGAEEGSDKQVEAFRRLGIATRDAEGDLRPIQDVFLESVEAIQGLSNETQKGIVAQQLFGRSASQLNPILNLSAEEMENLRDRAHELGLVISGDSILTLANFKDKWGEIEGQFRATRVELAAAFVPLLENTLIPLLQNALIPLLQDGVEKLQNLADRFFENSEEGKAFRAMVAGNIAGLALFGQRLFAVGEIAVGLGQVLTSPFIGMIDVIRQASDNLGDFAEGLGELFRGDFIGARDFFSSSSDPIDFQATLDKITGAALEGATKIGSGFELLLLDPENMKQTVLNYFENMAVEFDKGVRTISDKGGEAGESAGTAFASGLDSTKEDVAKAARDWATRLSEEVARGLRGADEALALLNPRIEELKKQLSEAFISQDAQGFNDTLAKLAALEQGVTSIEEGALKAADAYSKFVEKLGLTPGVVPTQGRPTGDSEFTSGRFTTTTLPTEEAARRWAAEEGILTALDKQIAAYASLANIQSSLAQTAEAELQRRDEITLVNAEAYTNAIEFNQTYADTFGFLTTTVEESTAASEAWRDSLTGQSWSRVRAVQESIQEQFDKGEVASYEFATALDNLNDKVVELANLNELKAIQNFSSDLAALNNTPTFNADSFLGVQKFLAEKNFVDNALALLGLDSRNQAQTTAAIAKRMREYADGATERFLAEKGTVDNALALLGLDDKNVAQVKKQVDDIVEDVKERFETLLGTLDDISQVSGAIGGLFGELASLTGSDLLGNLGQVANGFSDIASKAGTFAASLATGNIAGAITAGIGMVQDFISMLGDFSTNLESFERQALSTNEFLSQAAFNKLKVTEQQSVGGLLGLLGITKEMIDEEATQAGIDTFNSIANALASGIQSGGTVDIKSIYQNMLLEAFILSPEVQAKIIKFQELLTEVFADGVVSPEEALQLEKWEKTFETIGKEGQEALGIIPEEAQKAAEEAQAAFEELQGSIRSALENAFDAETLADFRNQFDVGIDEVIKKQLIAGLADPQIAALAKYIQEAIASDGLDEAELAEIEKRKRRILREASDTWDLINEFFPDAGPDNRPTPERVSQTEVDFSRVPQSIQLAVATPLLEASLNYVSAGRVFVEAANTFRDTIRENFNINISGLQNAINQWEAIQTRTSAMYERVLSEGFTVHANVSSSSRRIPTNSSTLLSRR